MSFAKGKGGMGFKDLQSFNDAMLGKQAWQLLENTTSLCARVLKGRYFPNCDFLSAGCPRSASRVWKAILIGRNVLQKGLVRRVGNGVDTHIWEDQWISGVPGLKPLVRKENT
jgi:hypothetical protein